MLRTRGDRERAAGGVIPAVLMYYWCFYEHASEDRIVEFLLTRPRSSLFRKARRSRRRWAVAAEIGVSSAMAAAGWLTVWADRSRSV